MYPQPPFPEEAAELQRSYAAHTLLIRGYLTNGRGVPVPAENWADLRETEVREGDDQVQVRQTFASPPLAAYLDGKYPLRLHVTRRNDEYAVGLSVPRGTNRRGGPVRLVWPSKTVTLRQPLRVLRRSAIGHFDLAADEAAPGARVVIGAFHQMPIEVHLAGQELLPAQWEWDGENLAVEVPEQVAAGPVLVITDGGMYQSSNFFRPAP